MSRRVAESQSRRVGSKVGGTLGLCSELATAIGDGIWNQRGANPEPQQRGAGRLALATGRSGGLEGGRNYTDAILKLQCQGPADRPPSPPAGTRGDAGVWRGSVQTPCRPKTLI